MFSKSQGGSSSSGEGSSKKQSGSAPNPVKAGSVPSLLSHDLAITGDIKTDGELQIDGRLDGNLTAGLITIGEKGVVNGKIVGSIVNIRGKVTGKIDATRVELMETANVQADIVQDQLVIANGAFFDGKCTRKSASPTPIKAAATQRSA